MLPQPVPVVPLPNRHPNCLPHDDNLRHKKYTCAHPCLSAKEAYGVARFACQVPAGTHTLELHGAIATPSGLPGELLWSNPPFRQLVAGCKDLPRTARHHLQYIATPVLVGIERIHGRNITLNDVPSRMFRGMVDDALSSSRRSHHGSTPTMMYRRYTAGHVSPPAARSCRDCICTCSTPAECYAKCPCRTRASHLRDALYVGGRALAASIRAWVDAGDPPVLLLPGGRALPIRSAHASGHRKRATWTVTVDATVDVDAIPAAWSSYAVIVFPSPTGTDIVRDIVPHEMKTLLDKAAAQALHKNGVRTSVPLASTSVPTWGGVLSAYQNVLIPPHPDATVTIHVKGRERPILLTVDMVDPRSMVNQICVAVKGNPGEEDEEGEEGNSSSTDTTTKWVFSDTCSPWHLDILAHEIADTSPHASAQLHYDDDTDAFRGATCVCSLRTMIRCLEACPPGLPLLSHPTPTIDADRHIRVAPPGTSAVSWPCVLRQHPHPIKQGYWTVTCRVTHAAALSSVLTAVGVAPGDVLRITRGSGDGAVLYGVLCSITREHHTLCFQLYILEPVDILATGEEGGKEKKGNRAEGEEAASMGAIKVQVSFPFVRQTVRHTPVLAHALGLRGSPVIDFARTPVFPAPVSAPPLHAVLQVCDEGGHVVGRMRYHDIPANPGQEVEFTCAVELQGGATGTVHDAHEHEYAHDYEIRATPAFVWGSSSITWCIPLKL